MTEKESETNAEILECARKHGFVYDPAPCLRMCGSEGSHSCNEFEVYGAAALDSGVRRSDTCDAYKAWRRRYLGSDSR